MTNSISSGVHVSDGVAVVARCLQPLLCAVTGLVGVSDGLPYSGRKVHPIITCPIEAPCGTAYKHTYTPLNSPINDDLPEPIGPKNTTSSIIVLVKNKLKHIHIKFTTSYICLIGLNF